jgi:tetratricopeptide (TPR) repeat protein
MNPSSLSLLEHLKFYSQCYCGCISLPESFAGGKKVKCSTCQHLFGFPRLRVSLKKDLYQIWEKQQNTLQEKLLSSSEISPEEELPSKSSKNIFFHEDIFSSSVSSSEELPQIPPEEAEVWIQEQTQKKDKKSTDSEALELLDPKEAEAWMNANPAVLKEVSSKAKEESPEEELTLLEKGNILMELGLYSQAVERFTLFLQGSPQSLEAYQNRGDCYQKLGLAKLASKDFQSVAHLLKRKKRS